MIINLVDVIMEKIFQYNLSLETKKALKYFLEENLNIIFGKTKFKYDEINIKPYSEQNTCCVVNGFHFNWEGNVYNFSLKIWQNLDFMSLECKNLYRHFNMSIHGGAIDNYITYEKEGNTIRENGYVFVGNVRSVPIFRYLKTIYSEGEEKERFEFGIKPTGIKKNGYTQFRIMELNDIEDLEISEKVSFNALLKAILYVIKFELKRTNEVIGIPFTNKGDMFDNLEDIFGTLKEYTKKDKEKTRKRVKEN